jgi:hypothetical protein
MTNMEMREGFVHNTNLRVLVQDSMMEDVGKSPPSRTFTEDELKEWFFLSAVERLEGRLEGSAETYFRHGRQLGDARCAVGLASLKLRDEVTKQKKIVQREAEDRKALVEERARTKIKEIAASHCMTKDDRDEIIKVALKQVVSACPERTTGEPGMSAPFFAPPAQTQV